MQLLRQAEKSGITLRSQNQRIFALKTKTANVRTQHGKAQQGSPAAAAKLGHKGGARVCRVRPAIFQPAVIWPAVIRAVFVRSVFAWPILFWRQMTRSKGGQQKGVRAKAQAALRLLQPSRKAPPRFNNMLRQGFLHGPSHIRKLGPRAGSQREETCGLRECLYPPPLCSWQTQSRAVRPIVACSKTQRKGMAHRLSVRHAPQYHTVAAPRPV